ncbi:MAG: hypothetical protein MJZ57_08470 [Bacteroidales bacterium]|nr:hypothetical protein [Bacteroidales bacterium]
MKTIQKITVIIAISCLAIFGGGCGLAKVINLVNCKFSMANVSDITWAGINLSNIKGVSDLSLANVQKAATAIKNKDFNVSCNVNVNVKNVTQKPAKLFAFDYELFLENALLATGSSKEKTFDITPASTVVVPVPVKVNIVDIVKNGEVGNIINFAKNLMDYGTGEESNIKVKLTPYVGAGNKSTKLAPITLNKTFQ